MLTAEARELIVAISEAPGARGSPSVSFAGPSARPRARFEALNWTLVGPVGLEPTTYGLKVRSSNH